MRDNELLLLNQARERERERERENKNKNILQLAVKLFALI